MCFHRKKKVVNIPKDVQMKMAQQAYEENIDRLKQERPGEYAVICCGHVTVNRYKSEARWEADVMSGYHKGRKIIGKKLFFLYNL